MKVVTIIGARPQIIKAAAISRAIQNLYSSEVEEVIVHTGQHYDENMSDVFFGELGIPKPQYNLNVGSGSHGEQTAKMIQGIEEVLLKEKPQALVLYGDTNSTLAGGIAASKLHIPVVHIEAGLRSYRKSMPEEVNRIMCDHTSTMLFSPTKAGVTNLDKEGLHQGNIPPYTADNPAVYHCGDIMYDNSLFFAKVADEKVSLSEFGIEGDYVLMTCHRPVNTDNPEALTSILKAAIQIAQYKTVLFPVHPRTKSKIDALDEAFLERLSRSKVQMIEPVSFLQMVALEKNSSLVLTDSGGVQKEAYFFKKPCVILRNETEWVEIVEKEAAILTGSNEKKIIEAYRTLSSSSLDFPNIFGDGKAAEFIVGEMVKHLG